MRRQINTVIIVLAWDYVKKGWSLKMSLERPLSFESNLFESKNKPHKAYYKRDGEWKQTKGFIAFLEKQKGVKSK